MAKTQSGKAKQRAEEYTSERVHYILKMIENGHSAENLLNLAIYNAFMAGQKDLKEQLDLKAINEVRRSKGFKAVEK